VGIWRLNDITGNTDEGACVSNEGWICEENRSLREKLVEKIFIIIHQQTGIWTCKNERIFSSSLCVQTGSGAHPGSCTMGTGGPFPGA
jgi:hypothetical protein